MAKKKKKAFHAPQTYGEKMAIPMTGPMRIISAVSLVLQAGLTAFAVYAAASGREPALALGYGFSLRFLFILLPAVCWLVTAGFRIACRALPLDMWRMPVRVREGMRRDQGRPLKLITLLVELETAAAFFYICVTIYLGCPPLDAVMAAWLGALILSVWLPARRAGQLSGGGPTLRD